jgi:hypothetical protein
MVRAADPLWLSISVYYTGAATFLSSSSSFTLTRAEWTPFQTHCYSENLVALGIEPGTSGLAARNSDYKTTEVARSSTHALPIDLTLSHLEGFILSFSNS